MMSRKKEAIFMGIGILAGLVLSGPAAQAATNITATLSNQPIYVDGVQASMTAYGIAGNNYVKLRDVGKAVGFNVYWDGSAVQIESDKPYTGEPPASQTDPAVQQSPAALTEESVQTAIWALRDALPHRRILRCLLPLLQQRPLRSRPHCLRGLGYPVQRRRLRRPAMAEDQRPELGGHPPRRPDSL